MNLPGSVSNGPIGTSRNCGGNGIPFDGDSATPTFDPGFRKNRIKSDGPPVSWKSGGSGVSSRCFKGNPGSGAFDRVVLRRSPNQTPTHVEVLDFKTDLVATPEDRQTRELHYAPQLTAYQSILGERFPAAQVSAHLVFI